MAILMKPLSMTWRTNLSFLIGATLLTLLAGWLIDANILPLHPEIIYSEAERSFVVAWIQAAIAVGLVLPGIAFLVWIRRSAMRTIFGFYLLVLAVQIMSEQICSRIFSASVVVVIGTLYTVFRIWQLWQSQRFLQTNVQSRYDRVAQGLLWLLLSFWSANLIFLLVVAWRRILSTA